MGLGKSKEDKIIKKREKELKKNQRLLSLEKLYNLLDISPLAHL